MTTGRTHDAAVYVDDGTQVLPLVGLLGLTIEGGTTITQEAYLGSTYEQASIHAMGGGVTFSTIFDTDAFDTLASLAVTKPQAQSTFVTLADAAPESWQAIPVTWPRASFSAPSDNAITRPWSLMRAGRGAVGTRVQAFSQNAGGTRTIQSAINANNGGILGVVIATIPSGVTAIALRAPGVSNRALGKRTGYFQASITGSGSVQLVITGGSAAVTGWVLQGKQEALPNG